MSQFKETKESQLAVCATQHVKDLAEMEKAKSSLEFSTFEKMLSLVFRIEKSVEYRDPEVFRKRCVERVEDAFKGPTARKKGN